jgi:CRP/FNR family cyclic AMP-dependent transcriptional regulator
MSLVDVLQEFGLFEDLDSAQLERIAAVASEQTFEPEAVVMAEYTRGDEMYFIQEGLLDVCISAQAGPGMGLYTEGGNGAPVEREMTVIARLLPGQAIGEVSLVDDGLRSATVVSVGTSTLVRIRRADLLRLCEEDTGLGYVVMRNIAAELAFKMRSSGLVMRGELWRPEGEDLTPGNFGFEAPLPDEPV